jgi:hypothetical protein
VLFPVSPADDNMVQAERRYEVRGDEGTVSFVASGSGPGLIYSALSDDPWQLESVNLNGAWDYGTLTIARDTKDPEGDITTLVQRLSSSRGFDYDVLDYAVYGDRGSDALSASSWWSPAYNDGYADCGCYGSSIYVGFGFSFGWPWYWYPPRAPYYYGYYPYSYYPATAIRITRTTLLPAPTMVTATAGTTSTTRSRPAARVPGQSALSEPERSHAGGLAQRGD